MMDRRAFLKRFGIGVTAALALAQLPASAIAGLETYAAAKLCACEYMRRIYNEWCKAHPGQRPQRLEAGCELFDAYEGELAANQRWCSGDDGWGRRNLLFKGTRLDAVGSGWTMRVAA